MADPRSPLPEAVTAPERGPVLCFAPHADDDLLGAGGTLALHTDQGDHVTMVIAYDGALGQVEDELSAGEYVALRQAEARRGGAHIGIHDYRFLGYPEGHDPDPASYEAAVLSLADLVRELAPATVYAPWTGEHQIDHHILGRAVLRALRLAEFAGHAWAYDVWTPLVPERVVDVSGTWPRVLAGLEQHASQMRHTRLDHHATGLAAHRALYLEKGAEYGEAFRAPY